MATNLAASITKAASQQTYYTIRFLVDPGRIGPAYAAYAYFRWVDDRLDASDGSACERIAFLHRQEALLQSCCRGQVPPDTSPEEKLLVDLVLHHGGPQSGLRLYLLNMMQVMHFDVGRRGRWISQAELNDYTRSLAVGVTEAIHYFIGHDCAAPRGAARYLAVTGAHITHMLRDTHEDARLGYYNVPREVLAGGHMDALDTGKEAYRAWVRDRVLLARQCFAAGKAYFAAVESARCRLASLAYIARFEWLLDTIEAEGYQLRPGYPERRRPATALRMLGHTLASFLQFPPARPVPGPVYRRAPR